MPSFSPISSGRLQSCEPKLRLVCNEAIKLMDFSVISGHRNEKDQSEMVKRGTSKLSWPHSKHNSIPSSAVDLAPYPIDWSNRPKAIARFYLLGGIMKAVAFQLGISLRAGWDWDGDWDLSDQTFDDLGHYELIE